MTGFSRILAVLGIVIMLGLLGLIAWNIANTPAAIERPAPAPLVLPTAGPTLTSTATENAFLFATATSTPTPTPTATPIPSATATRVPPENTPTLTPPPFVRPPSPRPPTFTPTAAPTPTTTPVPFPVTNEGGPVVDPSRSGCYYFSGYIRDSAGRGLANMQLRYLYRQPGPHFVFDTTRSGVEAGRYESYVGVNPNEVEVTVVDGNNNALSPTVTIALSGSNCWWVLNWKRNN